MAKQYFALDARIRCGGQHNSLVFHYQIDDPGTSDEWEVARQFLVALGTGGAASWITKLMLTQVDTSYLTSLRCRRVSNGGGNTAVAVFEVGEFPGDVASPVHTQQVAACIIWIPLTAGADLGRNFIPGVPKDALVGSRWTNTYEGLIDDFIAKHVTGESIAAGIMLPVVFDRVAGSGPDVADGYLSPKVGTQRRREVPL